MSDPKEKFMAAAVKSIGNPEQKLGLWSWLGESMGETDEESLVQVTRRWDEIDSKGKSGNVRKMVTAALVLIAVACSIPFLNTWDLIKRNGALVGKPEWSDSAQLVVGRELEPKESLLLGDPSMPILSQKQALIQNEPANPAFFAEYAVAYHRAHDVLPKSYSVTANRLDPDNAWFDYFLAAVTSVKAVEKIKQTKAEEKAESPIRWQIKDATRMMETLEILRLAKGKSRFQSYEETLLRQRIPLLSQANSGEHLTSYLYLCGTLSHQINMRSLADIIAASAWQAGEMGDVPHYQHVASDAKDLLGNLSKLEDFTLLGELVHRAVIAGVSPNLRAAAEQLHLEEEANYWRKMEGGVKRYNEGRKAMSRAQGGIGALMQEQGDMLVSYSGPMVARQVEEQIPVSEEDLKPGRMSNHRFLAAMSSRVGWLMLVIAAAVVALYQFRGSPALRLLAARGAALWKKSDWLWMVGLSVVVPLAVVIPLSLFPSIGTADHLMGGDRRNQTLGQHLAVALMMIILPVLVARWRFFVRAGAFGFSGKSWMGWVAMVSLVLFIPCFPCYLHARFGGALFCGHLAIFGGWILITVGIALFGKSRGLLRRLMVARVVLPMYLLGGIAIAFLSSLLLHSSQAWFEKDQFSKLTADAPAAMPYEYRVAKQLRKEIAEMMPVN